MIAGAVLGITPTEWCICLTLFGLVIALELVNTAIESVVDLVTTERKPLAKTAKDTAAGAVLVAAIMAAIVGLIIFVPRIASIMMIKGVVRLRQSILNNRKRRILPWKDLQTD